MTAPRLQPIRLDAYKPLREIVSDALRQAIRDGLLPPGERLMEIPLAEELGVSRTPIREAIRILEQEGLVVMIPRRGTYVADMSLKDVTEVFELRSILEELAAELAAERITNEEIEALIARRRQARADKNWAESDRIRDLLAAENITLRDGADGTTWTRG